MKCSLALIVPQGNIIKEPQLKSLTLDNTSKYTEPKLYI